MPYVLSRRRLIKLGFLGTVALGSSGCGTIMFPERIGQPAGPLDWKVVALDALGLLLFFVPGVIAFAVDFYNGTIYLPAGYPYYNGPPQGGGQYGPQPYYGAVWSEDRARPLATISVPRDELTQAKVEQVVSSHIQRDVRLTPGEFRTTELDDVEQFWPQHDVLAAS